MNYAISCNCRIRFEAERADRHNYSPWWRRGFIAQMRMGDPNDPLLRQVLPHADEEVPVAGFVDDPVAEHRLARAPGLLVKYPGRALLITTPVCAVHCRYCFRRHFPYEETPRSLEAWRPALDALAQDPSIREVILSGGDPLTVVDERLSWLACQLAAIGHLLRLRVHTRLPIVLPERINGELLRWLTGTRLTPIVVVHINHANEIDSSCEAALGRLLDAGVPVLNQAVLLRGINDDVESLVALCERLVNLRVMPYYLHQLDRVAGAAHFEVPESTGRRLIAELQQRLPGYAVPRYVHEIAGELGKTPLGFA